MELVFFFMAIFYTLVLPALVCLWSGGFVIWLVGFVLRNRIPRRVENLARLGLIAVLTGLSLWIIKQEYLVLPMDKWWPQI